MNVTVRDVARRAGVSVATVSRVVNGVGSVRKDMRLRVSEAIRDLDYRPNSVARSLKSTRTFTIGVIVSDLSNDYFTAMARSFEDEVTQRGYAIIVCSTNGTGTREREYLDLLCSRKIDGLLLNTTGLNDRYIAKISQYIPSVLLHRRIDSSRPAFRGDLVDSNNTDAAYSLTSHLLSLGHRRIALLTGPSRLSTARERLVGFKEAMKEAGITVSDDYRYRFEGDFTTEAGYGAANLICTTKERPSAVFVLNNAMCIGLLRYFRTNGVRVPEDISVACYGNLVNSEIMYVRPSIVSLDPATVGVRAAEALLHRIDNPSLPNRECILISQLIPGDGVRQL